LCCACHLLLLAHAPYLWSSISTCFPPCKQSLRVAGVCAGGVIGPLFVIDHLRSTLQAAAHSGGVRSLGVLGVGFSLGCCCPPGLLTLSPRPCQHRWCPLFHPVPAIIIPLSLLPFLCSSSLLYLHPHSCFIMVPVPVVGVIVLSWSWLSCHHHPLSLSCHHPPPIPCHLSSAVLVGI
jgi:hypothetical protein